jgi:hypothetical protein
VSIVSHQTWQKEGFFAICARCMLIRSSFPNDAVRAQGFALDFIFFLLLSAVLVPVPVPVSCGFEAKSLPLILA